jgi:enoyl-CoA hydratase/carnithine racemase
MVSALDLANRIACNPPRVLRWTKRLLKDAQQESLETNLGMAASYQALAHHTEDHGEAVSALLEKRKPSFKGR